MVGRSPLVAGALLLLFALGASCGIDAALRGEWAALVQVVCLLAAGIGVIWQNHHR